MFKFLNALALVALASAQSIEILQEGSGEKPPFGAEITAHYTGTLLDGTVFDSSIQRGRPFEFELGKGRVIKCWDEGFSQLTKGTKAILTCPPELAYGERAMSKIPANSTLKFEVELVDFYVPVTFHMEPLNEVEGELITKGK